MVVFYSVRTVCLFFATTHTFCTSRDCPRKLGSLMAVLAKTNVFAQFMTTREKQILVRDSGIRKEN